MQSTNSLWYNIDYENVVVGYDITATKHYMYHISKRQILPLHVQVQECMASNIDKECTNQETLVFIADKNSKADMAEKHC